MKRGFCSCRQFVCRPTNFSWCCISFHAWIHLSKFWVRGQGGDKVVPRVWPKPWPSKKQSFRIIFPKGFSLADHKKRQSRFLLKHLCFVTSKMVNFAPKRKAQYMSGTPFPTQMRFFYLYPQGLYEQPNGERWRHKQVFWHQVSIFYKPWGCAAHASLRVRGRSAIPRHTPVTYESTPGISSLARLLSLIGQVEGTQFPCQGKPENRLLFVINQE